MSDLLLPSLIGTNPLGLLAALGTLDAAQRQLPEARVRLGWTDETVPKAILTGVPNLEVLVNALDADREMWKDSALLNWPPSGPAADLKVGPGAVRSWIEAVIDSDARAGSGERLICGLVAEGGTDAQGKAKPTHLDFTAGQVRFLVAVRTLAEETTPGMLEAALVGDWRDTLPLPDLRWDVAGERVYALRATDPSTDKKLGVPGANWLAFVGLSFFPTWARMGAGRPVPRAVYTTACEPDWKRSALTWPLWSEPLPVAVVRSLIRNPLSLGARQRERSARGIVNVFRAPIRRTDQGGYGSFGGAEPMVGRPRESVLPGSGPSTLLRSQPK